MSDSAKSAKWDVLGFGVVTVDDIFYVDKHPPPGSKVRASDKQRHGGGLAATSLVAAARLGAKAAYCGVMGDDDLCQSARRDLIAEGVDCSLIIDQPNARIVHAIIIVDGTAGDRCIIYTMDNVVEPPLEFITDDLLTQCRVVFVDQTLVESGLHIVERSLELGIPVVADIEAVGDPRSRAIMDRVDHLIVGTDLAGETTGESDPEGMVRALDAPDRACVVVTAGDKGCWYSVAGGDVHHFPAFEIEPVDTTGCGDVFHGAYAACQAWGYNTRRSIAVATATAGLKATQPGGRKGIPDLSTVQRFLKEQGYDDLA